MADICGYCDKDGKHVEISFEETKDTRGRRYLKAICPDCGRTTKKWPKKEETPDTPEDTPEDTPADTPAEDIPEDIPEISLGDTIPDDSEGEQVAEIVEGIVTSPEIKEAITEEEEKEEGKPDKFKDIAIMILTAALIISIIVAIWYATKEKEAKHGKETD